MNSQLTIDLLQKFADAVRLYLRYNTEYRQARNPQRKATLKTTRANAYRIAKETNAALHTHLLNFTEPDFLRLQARKLIEHWDTRNTAFEDLARHQRTPAPGTFNPGYGAQWHETPNEKIQRLDRAENRLRDHLKAVTEIIAKLTDSQ